MEALRVLVTGRVADGGQVLQNVQLDRGGFACVLGGPDRTTLFITTAQWRSDLPELVPPGSGQVSAVQVTRHRCGLALTRPGARPGPAGRPRRPGGPRRRAPGARPDVDAMDVTPSGTCHDWDCPVCLNSTTVASALEAACI